MKSYLFAFLLFAFLCGRGQFTVNVTSSNGFTLTCKNKSLMLNALSNHSTVPNYTWNGPGGQTFTGQNFTVATAGVYTLSASAGTAMASYIFTVMSNTMAPVSSAPSIFTVTTGSSYTFSVISPTSNFLQHVYQPLGGVHTTSNDTMVYIAGVPGTYTHCIEDMVNGCTSCGTMVVCQMCGSPGTLTISISEGEQISGMEISVVDGGIALNSPYSCGVTILGSDGSVAGEVMLQTDQAHFMRLAPGVYIVRENGSRRKPYKLLVP